MARRNCRAGRGLNRSQAEATAAALIAQGRQIGDRGRQVATSAAGPPPTTAGGCPTAMEEDMPMNRYTFPLPCGKEQPPEEPPACPCSEPIQERILETLCYQNQLLVDILGAINALTAALLSIQCKR